MKIGHNDLTCPICSDVFKAKKALDQHVKKVHGKEKPTEGKEEKKRGNPQVKRLPEDDLPGSRGRQY
ncbi:hypothetical protein GF325_14145 [Candidatus Bathyarchaeota archaeon]|nr:hypothetical protein [Candidatus Bathyarchaeota archaeon]